MSLLNRIQKLCTPAYIYLVISLIILVVMTVQNVGDNQQYCAGNYACQVSNTSLIFLIKLIFVAFWTWVLNLICKAGAPIVSWVLVMFPIVLMFFLIALFILSGGQYIPTTNYNMVL